MLWLPLSPLPFPPFSRFGCWDTDKVVITKLVIYTCSVPGGVPSIYQALSQLFLTKILTGRHCRYPSFRDEKTELPRSEVTCSKFKVEVLSAPSFSSTSPRARSPSLRHKSPSWACLGAFQGLSALFLFKLQCNGNVYPRRVLRNKQESIVKHWVCLPDLPSSPVSSPRGDAHGQCGEWVSLKSSHILFQVVTCIDTCPGHNSCFR